MRINQAYLRKRLIGQNCLEKQNMLVGISICVIETSSFMPNVYMYPIRVIVRIWVRHEASWGTCLKRNEALFHSENLTFINYQLLQDWLCDMEICHTR